MHGIHTKIEIPLTIATNRTTCTGPDHISGNRVLMWRMPLTFYVYMQKAHFLDCSTLIILIVLNIRKKHKQMYHRECAEHLFRLKRLYSFDLTPTFCFVSTAFARVCVCSFSSLFSIQASFIAYFIFSFTGEGRRRREKIL